MDASSPRSDQDLGIKFVGISPPAAPGPDGPTFYGGAVQELRRRVGQIEGASLAALREKRGVRVVGLTSDLQFAVELTDEVPFGEIRYVD